MEKQNGEYRVVLVSDIHINKVNRLEDRIHALNEVSEYVNTHDIDLLIDLGDTFEKPNPTEEERIVYSEFVNSILIPYQKIGGNHETINNIIFAYDSSLKNLLIDGIAWQYITSDNESIAFVFCNYGAEHKIPTIINEIHRDNGDAKIYFFGHCTVNGAKTNSGHILRNDEVDATMFAPFEFAFLGDIHKRQMYKNWGYVGALVKRDAGEAGNADGFTVVTIKEDGSFIQEFIEIDGRDYITLIHQEGFPPVISKEIVENNIIS